MHRQTKKKTSKIQYPTSNFRKYKKLKLSLLIFFATLQLQIFAQEFCDHAGISNGWMLDQSSAEMDMITKACADTKALYFRADFAWSDVQWNSSDEWYWDNIDRLVTSTLQQNLEMIGILTYFPPWADQEMDTMYWSEFVYQAGLRYIPQGVTIYELWNEPNLINFYPQPDVQNYVEKILIPGFNAIQKAADELGVDVTVLTGGLAPAATDGTNIAQLDFVKQIYEYGGKNYFDVLAQHPYCWPLAPDEVSDFNWFLKTEELRNVMVENGDAAKLIWGTEMGWPTHDGNNGITPDQQAQYLTTAYTLWSAWDWTGPLIWYAYNDAGDDPQYSEDNFGLVTEDFTPKPSYYAWLDMIDACTYSSLDEHNFTSVNVYPNPTNNKVHIDTGEGTFTSRLYSASGQPILNVKNTKQIDCSGLAPGMYLLIYESQQISQSFKVVVY